MSIEIRASHAPRSGRPVGVHLFADDTTTYNTIYDLARTIGPLTWEALAATAADCEDAPTSRKDEARARFDQILDDIRRQEGDQCFASVGHLVIPAHEAQAFAGDVVEAAGNYREAAPVARLASVTRLHTAPGGAA